jgi:hypothetical protein
MGVALLAALDLYNFQSTQLHLHNFTRYPAFWRWHLTFPLSVSKRKVGGGVAFHLLGTMVKLSWPWWCALLSACTAWAVWRRWVAYNRRAFEFFLRRFEFHRAGGGIQKLTALDARLRQCALEGLENLPEERLQNFPGGELVVRASTARAGGGCWRHCS